MGHQKCDPGCHLKTDGMHSAIKCDTESGTPECDVACAVRAKKSDDGITGEGSCRRQSVTPRSVCVLSGCVYGAMCLHEAVQQYMHTEVGITPISSLQLKQR